MMLRPANSPLPIGILLVDDDDGDAKAVERTFLKARIANRIVRARDGVEALEILRGTDKQPRLDRPYLLLVDLNMPRMNGIQLVTAIREDPNCMPPSSSCSRRPIGRRTSSLPIP